MKEWRPMFRMLIHPLNGQWNRDPWFKDDDCDSDVRFCLSPMAEEPHISPFYFDLHLVLTQDLVLDYMRILSNLFSSPSCSSSLAWSMDDITMMVEEIFAQSIVKEYISPSPNNKIPLSAYFHP